MTLEGTPTSWTADTDQDGVEDTVYQDTNRDGFADEWGTVTAEGSVVHRDTNFDRYADQWGFDLNRDGVLDQSAIDSGGDGRADIWQMDQDADGLVDTMAFDMDGSGVADQWTTEAELVRVGDWSRGWTLPGVNIYDAIQGNTTVGPSSSSGWAHDMATIYGHAYNTPNPVDDILVLDTIFRSQRAIDIWLP